jgi:hypothetical protein
MPTAASPWVISDERFDITGRSREESIVGRIGQSVGLEFASREELETYVAGRRQKLENLRVFRSSSIEIVWPDSPDSTAETAADNGTAAGDAPVPVTLVTKIRDGTPITPIPYAFYNSNDGFQSGLVLNLPNLAGRLQNLTFVGVYVVPPNDDDSLQWKDPNFFALATWNGISAGPFSLAVTGLARRYKTDIVNRGETVATYRETGGGGGLSLSLPISERLTNTVSAGYQAYPETKILSIADDGYFGYGPIGSRFETGDELVWSAFNWEGNFRRGYLSKASVSYARTTPTETGTQNWLTAKAETALYVPVTSFLNPLFRVSAFAKTGESKLDAGAWTRGIRNNAMKGNLGFFANSGVQIKLFRLGSAELHLTPTLDFGFAYAPDDPDYEADWGFGAGSELTLILDSMRSLPIRFGMAYDLRPERFVKDGKRLEIDFNFSFAY